MTGAHDPSGQSLQLARTGQSKSLWHPVVGGVGTQPLPSSLSTPHGPLVDKQHGFALGGGTRQTLGSQTLPPQVGNDPTHFPPMHSTLGHAVVPSGQS